jgi:lysophospholipase L1-like esterase
MFLTIAAWSALISAPAAPLEELSSERSSMRSSYARNSENLLADKDVPATTARDDSLVATKKSCPGWRLYTEEHATNKVKDQWWQGKHNALVAKAKSTPARLQFFGDSITEGIGTDSIGMLKEKFPDLDPENFGIGGDITEELMFRITHGELGGKPKLMVVLIGTNDLVVPPIKSAHGIAQNVADIVEIFRTYQPASKVLVMGVLPRGGPDDPKRAEFTEKIKQINHELAQLDNGKKIRFIDIGSKFVDEKGQARVDLMPDYLHPNHKGYEVWFDAIKPTVNAMLKKD